MTLHKRCRCRPEFRASDYLGPQISTLSLRGSTTDPTLPKFTAEQRILAFLKKTKRHGVEFEPVQGEHGVIPIADTAELAITRAIVMTMLERGRKIRLQDVQDALRSQTPPPRVLLGSLLEELTLRVTKEEAPLVAEIACNSERAYLPQAQLWAVQSVGRLKINAVRSCLGAFVRERTNRSLALSSTEALGNLGDPASVPDLLSLLPEVPADQTVRDEDQDRTGDNRTPRGQGLRNEPEDEADPRPDPGEVVGTDGRGSDDGEPAAGTPLPPPTAADGEMEPDDTPSDDKIRRRADGGLSDAAILALGKVGDRAAVPTLLRIAQEGDDLALHSTVVRALGLIGEPTAQIALKSISLQHPNVLVRALAEQTLGRLR